MAYYQQLPRRSNINLQNGFKAKALFQQPSRTTREFNKVGHLLEV